MEKLQAHEDVITLDNREKYSKVPLTLPPFSTNTFFLVDQCGPVGYIIADITHIKPQEQGTPTLNILYILSLSWRQKDDGGGEWCKTITIDNQDQYQQEIEIFFQRLPLDSHAATC